MATWKRTRRQREQLVADLTEAALGILARHEVGGYSVDLEVDLWKKLDASVGGLPEPAALTAWRECCLAAIARAVYEVEHGLGESILDVELSLWTELDAWFARAVPGLPLARAGI